MKKYMKEIYKNVLIRSKKAITIDIKIKAQIELCNDNHFPHFAPTNGVCWRCRNQIYDKISLNKASCSLITGCPHCNYSYCS